MTTTSHEEFKELIQPGGALVEQLEEAGGDPARATQVADAAARSMRPSSSRAVEPGVTPADPARQPSTPAIYLGHGAPPLLEDPLWMAELAAWSASMPRPTSILIVSGH